MNGKPTYFVEKILRGIEIYKAPINLLNFWKYTGYDLFSKQHITPKIHTFREDKKDRWKAGNKIDFFINCRQKDMFRFAPVLPVVSVQEVFMTKRGNDLEITIAKVGSYIGSDDSYLYHHAKKELAINDGFDSLEEFNAYFLERINEQYTETGNSWFSGKIIHWTDLRY